MKPIYRVFCGLSAITAAVFAAAWVCAAEPQASGVEAVNYGRPFEPPTRPALIALPPGAVELNNSWGKSGYGGPQPPPGTGDHPYVVTLYALKVDRLDLKPATNLAGFQKALEGKILDTAEITGYYGR